MNRTVLIVATLILVGLVSFSDRAYGQSLEDLKDSGEQLYYERYGTYEGRCVEEYDSFSGESFGLVCRPYAPDPSEEQYENGDNEQSTPQHGPINFGSDYPYEETTGAREETLEGVEEPGETTAPTSRGPVSSSSAPEPEQGDILNRLSSLLPDSGGVSMVVLSVVLLGSGTILGGAMLLLYRR